MRVSGACPLRTRYSEAREGPTDAKIDYPRQRANKRSVSREKPEKGKSPGAKSGTTKRGSRRGAAKKANGRKGGAK
jgi:hypothetical protein